MERLVFVDLMGRLHPALVHLPVGILVLACCFELLTGREKIAVMRPAIRLMIFWGMLSAIAAVVTGLIIADEGGYEDDLVVPHQWIGISVAVVAILLYILYRKNAGRKLIRGGAITILILVTITGHLGGSLTHGEDYLTAALTGESEQPEMAPIPNIQEAVLYTDVVQPLLKSRCYNCHGEKKQKGQLRLDDHQHILKGGEDGNTLIPGKPEDSELIERILLPPEHDDHMPPKGKKQLTAEQVDVLHWWVATGADVTKKVKDLKQTEKIKPVLLALQSGNSGQKEEVPDVPEENVAPPDTGVVSALMKSGVMIMPVSRDKNYVSANFVTATGNLPTLLGELQKINKQVIAIKIDGIMLTDSSLQKLAGFPSLRKLQLSNTGVKDPAIIHLAQCKELRSLNLVGTSVTATGLFVLKELKNLENLYLYKTGITTAERSALKEQFPETNIDFGNYTLPLLSTDTTELKF